jgi:DNA-binding transcriptional MerR regulator
MNGIDESEGIDLNALCEEADVTPRTVYYYTQQGLLPSPGTGRGARYGETHRLRLAWIRHRQRAHLPLSAIRQELDRLPDAGIAARLAESEGDAGSMADALRVAEAAPRSSALDYLDSLPRTPASRGPASPSPRPRPPRAPAFARSEALPADLPPPAAPERSTWERHRLGEHVELHVRRPLDRITNRKVERLLELARELLAED